MKLRYAEDAVAEIRKIDPESALSARTIRLLAKQGVIPSVAAGNGRRRLIDVDVLVDYLSDPTKDCNERQK